MSGAQLAWRAVLAELLKPEHNGRGEGDRVDDASPVVTSYNRGIVVTVKAVVYSSTNTEKLYSDPHVTRKELRN